MEYLHIVSIVVAIAVNWTLYEFTLSAFCDNDESNMKPPYWLMLWIARAFVFYTIFYVETVILGYSEENITHWHFAYSEGNFALVPWMELNLIWQIIKFFISMKRRNDLLKSAKAKVAKRKADAAKQEKQEAENVQKFIQEQKAAAPPAPKQQEAPKKESENPKQPNNPNQGKKGNSSNKGKPGNNKGGKGRGRGK